MNCDPSGEKKKKKKDCQYPFAQTALLEKHFTLKLQCF